MSCDLREAFLDGTLEGAAAARFEVHLATCADCRAAVELAHHQAAALRAWAVPAPMPAFAPAHVVARARRAQRTRRFVTFAAAAAVVALLAVLLWPSTRAGPLLLDSAGVVAIANDTVTVEEGAHAQVEQLRNETRVTISSGSLQFQVAKRAAGKRFVVEASGLEVRVVGTRFRVQAGARPEVSVTEGVVEVWSQGAQLAVLRPGEQWPAVVPAEPVRVVVDEPIDAGVPDKMRPAPAKLLDVEAVTQAMVSGQLDDAQRLLDAHLARVPHDARAWLLLGDLNRRRGASAKAVEAYRKAASFGPDADTRTRARLFAASLLQDSLADGPGARTLLEACLKEKQGPKALEAPVLVRLARLDLAAGQQTEARRRLQYVLEWHPTTPSAVDARQLLDSIR